MCWTFWPFVQFLGYQKGGCLQPRLGGNEEGSDQCLSGWQVIGPQSTVRQCIKNEQYIVLWEGSSYCTWPRSMQFSHGYRCTCMRHFSLELGFLFLLNCMRVWAASVSLNVWSTLVWTRYSVQVEKWEGVVLDVSSCFSMNCVIYNGAEKRPHLEFLFPFWFLSPIHDWEMQLSLLTISNNC